MEMLVSARSGLEISWSGDVSTLNPGFRVRSHS